jgi:hypothetical protein
VAVPLAPALSPRSSSKIYLTNLLSPNRKVGAFLRHIDVHSKMIDYKYEYSYGFKPKKGSTLYIEEDGSNVELI